MGNGLMGKHSAAARKTRSRSTRVTRFGTKLAGLALAAMLMMPPAAAFAAEPEGSGVSPAVGEVLDWLSRIHVSGTDRSALEAAAIKGMIDSLGDPYTQYMTAAEWNQFESSLEQRYVGIGVRLEQDERGFLVIEVFAGSPAEAVGMRAGDYIVAADGKSYAGKTMNELTAAIMGTADTKVDVTYVRDGDTKTATMTRKPVAIQTVSGSRMEGGAGYIRIDSFSSDADELFAGKLDELEKQGITSLIVDLRGNPGGLLDSASNIAKRFIKDGVLIHTSDRNHVDDPIRLSGGSTVAYPVTVLVDQNSASASEVLSGALQDYRVATIVGTVTYGKGSVQTIYSIAGGGMLKVTIEEYLTPNKHKVNKVGIKPDVEVTGEIAQTIKAVHLSGVADVTIRQQPGGIVVNGTPFLERLNVIRDKGRVYVPSRTLAALVDADVAWNGDTKSVSIAAGGFSASYATGDDSGKFVDGTMYVALDAFAYAFDNVTWSDDAGVLTLHGVGSSRR
ncbi:MAG: PDZ domain-containing protein [Paenibacillaceae bacterium]|nr:PDZ domain-containing protein [Paenibacillaceae bacterium]